VEALVYTFALSPDGRTIRTIDWEGDNRYT